MKNAEAENGGGKAEGTPKEQLLAPRRREVALAVLKTTAAPTLGTPIQGLASAEGRGAVRTQRTAAEPRALLAMGGRRRHSGRCRQGQSGTTRHLGIITRLAGSRLLEPSIAGRIRPGPSVLRGGHR